MNKASLITSVKRGYYEYHFLAVLMFLCVGSGIIYCIVEQSTNAYFTVLLLCMATFCLLIGVRWGHSYIINQAIVFFPYIMRKDSMVTVREAVRNFHDAIFQTQRSLMVGFCWGVMVPIAITYYRSIGGVVVSLPSAIALFIFLFFVNFWTGLVFSAMWMVFTKMLQVGRLIDFDRDRRINPATQFVLSSSSRLSLLASLYSSLCMLTVFPMNLKIELPVALYSIFSPLVALSVYFIPTWPLRQKFIQVRKKSLDEVNANIDSEVERAHRSLGNPPHGDEFTQDDPFIGAKRLVMLRGEIVRDAIWPYSVRTIFLVTLILLFAFTPAIVGIIQGIIHK